MRIMILGILILIASQSIGQAFDGFALYNDGNTTFLINKDGEIAHTWNLPTRGNYSMFIKNNGNLVRGAVNINNNINGAAVGGLVQEFTPRGELVWEFDYSSNEVVAHHDICAMPNGGVLLTAWEVVPGSELDQLGYTGNNSLRYGTHFIEVQQEDTGGKIVWEWHLKDHFVQDVDSTLANFGNISANPQLLDVNVPVLGGGGPGGPSSGDWFHVNGVNYSEDYDQIIFSSRFLSEVMIIDHSTTIEEAASHAGGNSGQGGDILWRWGNPSNYNTEGTRTISAAVHDAQFIPDDGRDFADHALIFNNEGLTGQTQIDIIELPRSGFGFEKVDTLAFGPPMATKTHFAIQNVDGQSATYKLPNGNLYVNLSRRFQYEVDKNENVVWQYPDASTKGFRYTCDHPGIQTLIDQGFIDELDCELSSTKVAELKTFKISPNPSKGLVEIKTETAAQIKELRVFDLTQKRSTSIDYKGSQLDLSGFTPGVYFLQIILKSGEVVTKQLILS